MPQLEAGDNPEATMATTNMEEEVQDDREPCPRGMAKMERRSTQWAAFAKRRRLLTLGALPANVAPKRSREATGYFLYIHKTEGWVIPPPLLAKVNQMKTELQFSVSLTFYHATSKRFFGSTVMGQHVEGPMMKELIKKSQDAASAAVPQPNSASTPVAINVSHDDILYWYSRVVDPDCMAILELVATDVDSKYGVGLNQYACGWTILRPFGNNTIKDAEEEDNEGKHTFETLPVYKGTPRQLLFLSDSDWVNLKTRTIPGCSVVFRLRKFHRLLRAMDLFNENEIVSAVQEVPGLTYTTVKLPQEDKHTQAPVLGAHVVYPSRKNLGQPIVSPALPNLAPSYSIELQDIEVVIPERAILEKNLLATAMSELPNLKKEMPPTRTLGMSMTLSRRTLTMQASDDLLSKDNKKATIVSRFLKVGMHNGRTLIRQNDDEFWQYLKMDEQDDVDEDLLRHHSMKDPRLTGFSKHKLFSLVFLLEYSIRVGSKRSKLSESKMEEGKGGDDGQPLIIKVPIVLGGQTYCPFDGKRLRVRNMPAGSDPNIELMLEADDRCRILTNELIFSPLRNQSLLKTRTIQEPIALGMNLKVYDSNMRLQEDETPQRDADESESESEMVPPDKQHDSEPEESSSEESSSEEETSESEEESMSVDKVSTVDGEEDDEKKKRKKKKHKKEEESPKKHHKKHHRHHYDSDGSEGVPPSIVSGDSYSSYLRRRWRHKPRGPPASTTTRDVISDFEAWRMGIHPPTDKNSLLGQSLQAAIQGTTPAGSQPPSPEKRKKMEAVSIVGQMAKSSPEMTRAAKTRLSRYGYGDVTGEAGASVILPPEQRDVVSRELELADELSRHEITIQFAAYRITKTDQKPFAPSSLFFTFQFYKYAPTRTEKVVLREDGMGDRLTYILIRESQYGREAPAKAYRFVIDTGGMLEAEARSFIEYLFGKNLTVDVWDGDSMLLLGSFSIPLWKLMRQGNPVAKIAHEYECLSPLGSDEENGRVSISGFGSSGSKVMGYVQVLACNYGEKSESTCAPQRAIEGPMSSFHNNVDWRLRLAERQHKTGGDLGFSGTRPRSKVRARPLSESHREVGTMLDTSHLRPSDGTLSRAAAAFRAAGDDRCITYDELFLIFKRFRGEGRTLINYKEKLLDLLCLPSVQALEKKFVRLVTRAEEQGASLEDVFRYFDSNRDGLVSVEEMEEGLRKIDGIKNLRSTEIRMLVKRFQHNREGQRGVVPAKVDFRRFIEFIRSKQPNTNVELKLKRILTKAELANLSVSKIFTQYGTSSNGEDITPEDFRRGLSALGPLSASLTPKEMDSLVRKLVSKGRSGGNIPLHMLAKIHGKEWVLGAPPPAAAATPGPVPADSHMALKLKQVLHQAQLDGLSVGHAFAHFDKEGTGLISEWEFEQGLNELGVFKGAEGRDLLRGWAKDSSGKISWREFVKWTGEPEVSPERLMEEKMVKVLIKAIDMGQPLQQSLATFDPDHTGKVTVASLEAGLKGLSQFGSLTREESEQLFSAWDTDKDGVMTLAEIESMVVGKMGAVKKAISTRKRQMALGKLRDALLSTLEDTRHAGSSLTLKAILSSTGRGSRKDQGLNGADLEEALLTFVLGQGTSPNEDEKAYVKEAVEAFKRPGGEVNLTTFEDWLSGVALVVSRGPVTSASTSTSSTTQDRAQPKEEQSRGDSSKGGRGEGKALLAEGKGSKDEDDDKAEEKRGRGGGKEAKGGNNKSREESLREEEEEEEVSAVDFYEYSKDIETQEVEKKLRRAARAVARQGVDLEAVIKELDPEGLGTIPRADFVQLLMELGLSLVDGPGASYSAFKKSIPEGERLRERQMAQLAAIQGWSDPHLIRMRPPPGSSSTTSTNANSKAAITTVPLKQGGAGMEDKAVGPSGGTTMDASESLAMIKLYRDGQKRQAIRDMLMQSMRTTYRIFPKLGDMEFFEFPFTNPFGHEERFQILITDPASELKVIQSSEEWAYLRHNKRPAVGDLYPLPKVERDMVDSGDAQGVQVTLNGLEVLPIPFSFLTLCSPKAPYSTKASKGEEKEEVGKRTKVIKTLDVSFVSASHGNIVAVLQVEVHIQPLIVDRVLRFHQVERTILRRCVRYLPHHSPNWDRDDEEEQGGALTDASKYVHCLDGNDGTKRNVVVEWRQLDGSVAEEILIKYMCGSFPDMGIFYLLIYNDHYQASLHEVWRVEIHSCLGADVHSFMGQAVDVDLPIRGDRFNRRVLCYTSSPSNANFDMDGPLKIPAGGQVVAKLKYRPSLVGQEKVKVHVVDTDTNELVYSWLVTATSNPPIVTKTYDVDLPVGQPAHKKIAYLNPWDKSRCYTIVSSDESIMKPRFDRLEIPPNEKAYIRVYFARQNQVHSRFEVFLFLNDSKGQNEECFLVRVRVTDL